MHIWLPDVPIAAKRNDRDDAVSWGPDRLRIGVLFTNHKDLRRLLYLLKSQMLWGFWAGGNS
jgi:hypothetical protein